MFILFLDDEELSLVIDPAHSEGGNAADVNHVAHAPDDDTLSVGPDMPELPLDARPESVTPTPQASTAEVSTPKEVQPVAENEEVEASPDMEQGNVEEESTVREKPSLTEPQVELEEGASAQQQEESGDVEGEDGGKEERQQEEGVEEQRAACAPHAEEAAAEEQEVGEEETQPKPDSDNPGAVTADDGATTAEASTEENIISQEAPAEPAEGATQEATVGGDRGCTSCICQSLFSNYNSHAPSRRKNRPCSLPVSELETVIASACGEPETPRSHYIRIHHLLHSLPSAQHRPPSQEEEEETGDGENTSTTQDTTSTSVTLKTSKDREEDGQKDEEEEDTTQSPSQVQPPPHYPNTSDPLVTVAKLKW